MKFKCLYQGLLLQRSTGSLNNMPNMKVNMTFAFWFILTNGCVFIAQCRNKISESYRNRKGLFVSGCFWNFISAHLLTILSLMKRTARQTAQSFIYLKAKHLRKRPVYVSKYNYLFNQTFQIIFANEIPTSGFWNLSLRADMVCFF